MRSGEIDRRGHAFSPQFVKQEVQFDRAIAIDPKAAERFGWHRRGLDPQLRFLIGRTGLYDDQGTAAPDWTNVDIRNSEAFLQSRFFVNPEDSSVV
jgi:hypothetical protein